MGLKTMKGCLLASLLLCAGGLVSACFEKADLPLLDGSTDLADDDVLTDQIDAVPDRIDAPEDTAVEDPPDLPDEPACEPASRWCEGSDLVTCSSDGSGTTSETCPLGCGSTGGAHCLWLVPSNFADATHLCVDGTGDLSLPLSAAYVRINTETGSIDSLDSEGNPAGSVRGAGEGIVDGINFAVVRQEGGPALGVFSVQSMQVPSGVIAFGLGNNALVILSCGDVEVSGRISVDAMVTGVGPATVLIIGAGGYPVGMSTGGGGDGLQGASLESGGGGGGGFGGAGGVGSGSEAGTTPLGGSGGSSYGNPGLVPLQGGSGGGLGSDNDLLPLGLGGPGGGALQLTSGTAIRISSTGIVTALGLGGFGGNRGAGGGGGGSGGGILIEAASVVIESGGIVAANGGGGGSAGVFAIGPGANGEPGQAGAVAAAGGESDDETVACPGGDGNSSTVMDGETLPCTSRNGGGGGGAAGRIRLNALAAPVLDGVMSPDPGAAGTTATSGPLNLQ